MPITREEFETRLATTVVIPCLHYDEGQTLEPVVKVYKDGRTSRRCSDCGKHDDCIMLRDSLWFDVLGLRGADMVCLACVSKRLGRPLYQCDFPCAWFLEYWVGTGRFDRRIKQGVLSVPDEWVRR